MKESGVIRIKEHPKLMREAALWFHEKWGEVPVSAYLESMKESLRGRDLCARLVFIYYRRQHRRRSRSNRK